MAITVNKIVIVPMAITVSKIVIVTMAITVNKIVIVTIAITVRKNCNCNQNQIFLRKIVIFHTKYPKNFNASHRNWKKYDFLA
jgi:hypothetical protein